MYHPWEELRGQAHITLAWASLPDSRPAETDGIHIWMSRSLDQVERRCVLTHELVHVALGHTQGATPYEEYLVRSETARRLITLESLIEARYWAHSLDEAAEELWVIPQVLQDRLLTLRPAERTAIQKEAPEWPA